MRVLVTTTAGIGHLHPLVPLARAARDAGHAVRVAAPASLGPVLTDRGLPHLELPDYGPEQSLRVEEVMRRLGPPGPGAEVAMFREVFGWAKTASTLDAMRRAVATHPRRSLRHDGPTEPRGTDSVAPADIVHYQLTDIHGGGPRPVLRGATPLVWIALGTETWRIPGLKERITPLIHECTGALPNVRFLLTTGAAERSVPTLPSNVEVVSYVPQEAVLAACDAVLGHGGFNTTIAALSRGIPLVLVPLFATDQFDNADRVAAAGAGVAITEPDPVVVAEAVDRTLTDPGLRSAAERLADEMAALPTPSGAIERLLATGEPRGAVAADLASTEDRS